MLPENAVLSYEEWVEVQIALGQSNPSYNAYRFWHNEHAPEYVCVVLDPNYKLYHQPQEPMFASNDLGSAMVFVMKHFNETGEECAVYQPAGECYREVYRHKPKKHNVRARNGRFAKETA